jgi:phosphonate transport system substrate-binding protein
MSIYTGHPTILSTSQCLHEFSDGRADVGFLCGLLYTHLTAQETCPVELLAAPVLSGTRYRGQPLYFSDVIVRADSSFSSFADLQGCTWAYNEGASHSGCNLVNYSLLERGKSPDYFGVLVKSGSHLNSLQMVLAGEADAAAIDSHLLDVVRRRDAQAAAGIRVVDVLGPSAVPPVVVARRLDPDLKHALREMLITMHENPFSLQVLREGGIECFVPVDDEWYDDIRSMYTRVQATDFPRMFR